MSAPLSFENLALRNVVLAEHSSYEIGGKADYFAAPESLEKLLFLLNECRKLSMPFSIFGFGTNTLFPDHPQKGKLYISLKNFLGIKNKEDGLFLTAGIPLSFLSLIGILKNKENFYFTYLLPGSIGAGIYINAKCYQDQISDLIEIIHYIDLNEPSFHVAQIQAKDCGFAYKDSVFQKKPWIIVGAEITGAALNHVEHKKLDGLLKKIKENQVSLSLLKKFYAYFSRAAHKLEGKNKNSRLREIEQDRNSKKHFDYPSCGSVFKNNYDIGIPMGKITEELGLKGKSFGKARVSPCHGNIIINNGGATAVDVTSLMDQISEAVTKKHGFVPEREVIIEK